MRVSTSVARSRRRITGSSGTALAAPGAAEVMGSPCLRFPSAPQSAKWVSLRIERPRRHFWNGAALEVQPRRGDGSSLIAELDRSRLHAVADLGLSDPALVDD